MRLTQNAIKSSALHLLQLGLLCALQQPRQAAALTAVVEQRAAAGVAGHTTYRCYLRFDAEDVGRKANVYTIFGTNGASFCSIEPWTTSFFSALIPLRVSRFPHPARVPLAVWPQATTWSCRRPFRSRRRSERTWAA